MDSLQVLGMGEILWDIFPNGKQLGGAPANFSFHAKQLGLKAGILSAVGKDQMGDEILNIINSYQLRNFIQTNNYPTGTVTVQVDKMGIPNYVIHENVAWDHILTTDETLQFISDCKAICFGSLAQRAEVSGNTIIKLLQSAPSHTLKVFDINLRQHFYSPAIISHSLELANFLKINDEEILVAGKMFDLGSDETLIARKLMEKFELKYLALTKGGEGSWFFSDNESSWLKTPLVEVADTVGAGDSFTAAMVSGILKGKSTNDTHQLAVDVSAFVCTQKGATPELPEKFSR